jgi:hypothetical protein
MGFDQKRVKFFCEEKGLKLFYVSAKTGENINASFYDLTEKLTTIHPQQEKKKNNNADDANGGVAVSSFLEQSNRDKKCC